MWRSDVGSSMFRAAVSMDDQGLANVLIVGMGGRIAMQNAGRALAPGLSAAEVVAASMRGAEDDIDAVDLGNTSSTDLSSDARSGRGLQAANDGHPLRTRRLVDARKPHEVTADVTSSAEMKHISVEFRSL
jgi:hypothetical protein